MNRVLHLSLLGLAALVLSAGSCEKPRPVTPVAGIYAVRGQAKVSWGPKKNPTVRRAQAGMLLMSNVTLESDEGLVLEAFDGSFVWLPDGSRDVGRLKLPVGASEGALRPIVVVSDEVVRKNVPPPVVMARYEPAPGKPIEVGDDAQLKSDMAYFFTPKSDAPAELPDEAPRPPPEPPWKKKEKYVHPLRRPLKPGDGARMLTAAKGAVVVEFQDNATAFADTLKLPVDLADVRRIVVVDGSAKLKLPAGKALELKAGDIAEIEPLP